MSSAINFSCKICENNVTNCDQATYCDLCNSWVHIKCNDSNYIDYKSLQSSNDPWLFFSCCSETLSFNTVKNKKKTFPPFPVIVTTNLKNLMTKTAL